jgi:hypothetical protein
MSELIVIAHPDTTCGEDTLAMLVEPRTST